MAALGALVSAIRALVLCSHVVAAKRLAHLDRAAKRLCLHACFVLFARRAKFGHRATHPALCTWLVRTARIASAVVVLASASWRQRFCTLFPRAAAVMIAERGDERR